MFQYFYYISKNQRALGTAFASLAALCSSPVTMAASNRMTQDGSDTGVWNLVIALIVMAATLASAALCIAAYRNWPQTSWRLGAMLPVAVLALLMVFILASRIAEKNSHALWPLELFAWSMVNMIYMVGLMTTKRIFEKADAQGGTDSR